jgi:hypothetical protein
MGDAIVEVQVQWREIDGQSVQTLVPTYGGPSPAPLYVRHLASGWAVFHAGEQMGIRHGMKRDQAIHFMLAIRDLVDWSLPVGQIITQNIGLNARLDQVARSVLNAEHHRRSV